MVVGLVFKLKTTTLIVSQDQRGARQILQINHAVIAQIVWSLVPHLHEMQPKKFQSHSISVISG